MAETVTFSEFETQWLSEIQDDKTLSTVEKGRKFAIKLITQWLDISEETDDFYYCDGASDGGIDIAYLQRDDDDENEDAISGHAWYIIQSKFGTSFAGKETLLIEAQKVINTLRGDNQHLSEIAADVVNRISEFLRKASDNDRIIFVIATCDQLSDDEIKTLSDIRVLGQNEFGLLFEVESVTIDTIYKRTLESLPIKHTVKITAELVPSGVDLLVGSVRIVDLYMFLKEYKAQTNDLDLIYEKNVRKFLGNRNKVNIGIQETLNKTPERFGLYNNGITIVVEDFVRTQDNGNTFALVEPFIVNGCQTTKSIWGVLDPKLSSGGTGSEVYDEWRKKLDEGIVVVKIVKVGDNGGELLTKTTRYTNSQTAVKNQDFIALDNSFQEWQRVFAEKHGIYLEIQRGAWDAQKARQQHSPIGVRYFDKYVSAFDLLKIHGAGWMGRPGLAYGKNPPFSPGGSVFKDVVSSIYGFTVTDLYAAYILNMITTKLKFGRGAEKQTRGQSKYLFCYILVDLLKYCMQAATIDASITNISSAVISLLSDVDSDVAEELQKDALSIIDFYLTQTLEDSFIHEVTFSGDLNAFLKNDNLGKKDFSPLLVNSIRLAKLSLMKDGYVEKIGSMLKELGLQ